MNESFEVQLEQAAPAPESPGIIGPLLPILALFLLMYALLIRPQQRQQKEHKAMVDALKQGDRVVTSGGIHGRITGITDDVITLEIAERVRIKVNRGAVATRQATAATPKKEDAA